jgi:hypothetical protein
MAEEKTPEVKEEVIDAPELDADGNEIVPPKSSPEGDDAPEGDEPEEVDEPIDTVPVVKKPEAKVEIIVPSNGLLKRLPDESDREWAQRLEINRLRNLANGNRGKDMVEAPKVPPVVQQKKESDILKKYKPADVAALKEVLAELAPEMGFVKKDELNQSTYENTVNDQIASFIADHPEYTIEKDPEQVLWKKLKEEYQAYYKQPANPKDFKKLLERIHGEVFGIQPKGPLPKDNAAREKIKVASHTANSVPAPRPNVRKTTTGEIRASGGLRLDMLKGFSEEERANIESKAEE